MRGFSEGALELYGVMSFREANMNAAVVEQLREIVGRAFEDMQEIAGGMDQLPKAFYEQLKPSVRFGAEVTSMEQDPNSVTVHYKTAAGRFSVRGDYAICAIPFSVLRDIEILNTPFSHAKQKAIRELNYNASTKIVFQTRHRFWEQTDGIVGGTTVTDLPIRRICYPSFSDPAEERGTLLASYTWGQDALRWGAMDAETMIEQALEARRPGAPRDNNRVRGWRSAGLVRRHLGARCVRAVRARAADTPSVGHRRAGRQDPLRGRAHLALPRLDPGCARVGHPCR